MKQTQNPFHLAIFVATSLVLFSSASNAEGIQCPSGKQSIEVPAASGNHICIDTMCRPVVAAVQALYSGTSSQQTAVERIEAERNATLAAGAEANRAAQEAKVRARMESLAERLGK